MINIYDKEKKRKKKFEKLCIYANAALLSEIMKSLYVCEVYGSVRHPMMSLKIMLDANEGFKTFQIFYL